jgi:threonine dehydrogenase-like Zn-dependent dehydrogenase
MPALQVCRPRTFVSVQVPIPSPDSIPGPALLVRTYCVSLCGSDIPKFTGSKRLFGYPLPPGSSAHECLGQVVESTSDQFAAGDWVIALPEADKGLAQFFLAQAAKAVKLPAESAAAEENTLIQPLSTVMSGFDRLPSVRGKTVAVVGLGSIGLMFTWLLRRAGAASVVGIDPCESRCELARQFGATQTWPMRSLELVHAVRQGAPGVTHWETPDIIVEAVGHQTETINDCFELIKRKGTVLAFGVPDQNVYAIEYEIFFRKNAHLLAAVTPDWSAYLLKARDLFLSCRSELRPLITHHFSILDAGRAYTLYEQHADGIIKPLLDATCWESPSD